MTSSVSIRISFSHEIIMSDSKCSSHIDNLKRVFINFNLENACFGDALDTGRVSAIQSPVYSDRKIFFNSDLLHSSNKICIVSSDFPSSLKLSLSVFWSSLSSEF